MSGDGSAAVALAEDSFLLPRSRHSPVEGHQPESLNPSVTGVIGSLPYRLFKCLCNNSAIR